MLSRSKNQCVLRLRLDLHVLTGLDTEKLTMKYV